MLPPDTPGWSAGATANAFELQITSVCAVTNGFGLTVTVTLKAVPEQLPEVGVTE